jgi:hypothetical protein
MSLASAMQGCRDAESKISPAFMIFQVGPVQEFIAQARSTRDLWSGSYLLSWMTAHAIKSVSDEVGPDSIIFPALRGQGIVDALYKTEIYDKVEFKGDTLWKRMYRDGDADDKISRARRLLTPSLPNRFLALLPSDRAEEIALKAKEAALHEISNISEKCWKWFSKKANEFRISDANLANWKDRWDKQVELFPQINWQTMPWEEDIDSAMEKFRKLPINNGEDSPCKNLDEFRKLAADLIPEEKRDSRYYLYGDIHKGLKSPGFVWSANYYMTDFAMAARRNLRDFEQFTTDPEQDGSPKDVLSGREEIIGNEEFWKKLTAQDEAYKKNEKYYGAINIIKRTWCRKETGYLLEKLDIEENIFWKAMRFESVEDIAKGNREKGSPYVAVIALDGDEMGKWISGKKAPEWLGLLSDKAREYFEKLGVNKDLKRQLTPSYHLQFSEALANFANHMAEKIIYEFDGQLIYAGGDDILAMLPADKAIECARTLRAVFRGRKEEFPEGQNKQELAIIDNGFVRVGKACDMLVPGEKADVSCGIAIGYCKTPLQSLVKEAQSAEKKAKNEYGRASFALSLLKRGGETIHWGAKWNSHALDLYFKYRELATGKENALISNRFPYALAELLRQYNLDRRQKKLEDASEFDKREVILREFSHVMAQQAPGLPREEKAALQDIASCYLDDLQTEFINNSSRENAWGDFEKLFLTAAFIGRKRGEE